MQSVSNHIIAKGDLVQQTAANTQVISKSYLSGLILKCSLFFAGGLILTGAILYFSAHQPLGPTYQESFARLSQLKQEMLVKSITIYFLLTTLILAGVIFITLLYSHRVVGPLIGIKRVVRAITAGDLTQPVRLRQKDAIKPMAEALNSLMDSYKTKMLLVTQHTQAMQAVVEQPEDPAHADKIATEAKAINAILAPLTLR